MGKNRHVFPPPFISSAGVGLIETTLYITLIGMVVVLTLSLGIMMFRSAATQQSINAAGHYLLLHPEEMRALQGDTGRSEEIRAALERYALSQATLAGILGITRDNLVEGIVLPRGVPCHIAVLLPGEYVVFPAADGSQIKIDHPLPPGGSINVPGSIVFVARVRTMSTYSWHFERTVVSPHLVERFGSGTSVGAVSGTDAGVASGTGAGSSSGAGAGVAAGTGISTGTDTGIAAGTAAGTNSGSAAGAVSGSTSGLSTGTDAGLPSGIVAGASAGTLVGPPSTGTDSGTVSGAASGTVSGILSGTTSGASAGASAGVSAGTVSGSSGGVSGGMSSGTSVGLSGGSEAGTVTGVSAGSTAGSSSGTVAGTSAGSPGGSNSGAEVGTPAGSSTGSAGGTAGGVSAGSSSGVAGGTSTGGAVEDCCADPLAAGCSCDFDVNGNPTSCRYNGSMLAVVCKIEPVDECGGSVVVGGAFGCPAFTWDKNTSCGSLSAIEVCMRSGCQACAANCGGTCTESGPFELCCDGGSSKYKGAWVECQCP